MDKITFLDGSVEEQTNSLKAFFGLSSDQSFQELQTDGKGDEGNGKE